jgi:hypothetical protein
MITLRPFLPRNRCEIWYVRLPKIFYDDVLQVFYDCFHVDSLLYAVLIFKGKEMRADRCHQKEGREKGGRELVVIRREAPSQDDRK